MIERQRITDTDVRIGVSRSNPTVDHSHHYSILQSKQWYFYSLFYGYFLNRIPLLRRLKLREVISFKGLYGSLSDSNNPNLNPDMIQFSNDENGVASTYVMDGDPYIEASFGLTNIFKFLRLDIVKRFTYLDQPNLPELWGQKGMGIRATFLVEF